MAGKLKKTSELSPATKFKQRIIEETIDNYERAHGLGAYAPPAGVQIAPIVYPKQVELSQLSLNLTARLSDGLTMTTKEGVRQDYELAMHHVRIAERYFKKATAI